MARSCACTCHHSRVEKLRAHRARLAAELELIDAQIEGITGPRLAVVPKPDGRRGRPASPSSNECIAAICSVIEPGEEVASKVIANRVEKAHPGRWPRSGVMAYACFAYDKGYLVKIDRGVYRLP